MEAAPLRCGASTDDGGLHCSAPINSLAPRARVLEPARWGHPGSRTTRTSRHAAGSATLSLREFVRARTSGGALRDSADVLSLTRLLYLNYPNNDRRPSRRWSISSGGQVCRDATPARLRQRVFRARFRGYVPAELVTRWRARGGGVEFPLALETSNMTGCRCGWAGASEIPLRCRGESVLGHVSFMAIRRPGGALEAGQFRTGNVAVFGHSRDADGMPFVRRGFECDVPRAVYLLIKACRRGAFARLRRALLLEEGCVVMPGFCVAREEKASIRISFVAPPLRARPQAAQRAVRLPREHGRSERGMMRVLRLRAAPLLAPCPTRAPLGLVNVRSTTLRGCAAVLRRRRVEQDHLL